MLDKVLANIVSMYSISRLSHDYLHVLGGSEIVVEFYNYRRFILLQKSVEYKEIKKYPSDHHHFLRKTSTVRHGPTLNTLINCRSYAARIQWLYEGHSFSGACLLLHQLSYSNICD